MRVNALVRLSLVFRAPLREGAPFVVDLEQEAVVWAKGRGECGRRRRRGRRRSKTKRSTHTNPTNRPSRCTTSRSPSCVACSPPSSGAWGAARRVCCRASLGDALHRHRGQVGVWRERGVLSAVSLGLECDFGEFLCATRVVGADR
jgi:hypothetical protein